MINTNKLKGIIAERNQTQANVAKYLGISKNTMSIKMKKGIFNSDEIDKMIEFLQIEKPEKIFFS